jgi:hypothetical protein
MEDGGTFFVQRPDNALLSYPQIPAIERHRLIEFDGDGGSFLPYCAIHLVVFAGRCLEDSRRRVTPAATPFVLVQYAKLLDPWLRRPQISISVGMKCRVKIKVQGPGQVNLHQLNR